MSNQTKQKLFRQLKELLIAASTAHSSICSQGWLNCHCPLGIELRNAEKVLINANRARNRARKKAA